MALADDPKILRGPIKFAGNVNEAADLDVDAMQEKVPGLLQFAKTFIAQILEQEFEIKAGGYPIPTRERAAALTVRLKDQPEEAATRSLIMAFVDICDFEIDLEETYGSEDQDEDDFHDEILELTERLLRRFAKWLDPNRFERLSETAEDGAVEFAVASAKLKSR